MYETLKMLERLNNPEVASKTLEQLSSMYQEQQRPDILAAAYKKVFPWIVTQKNKYVAFSEQEVGSFALEKLDMCLQMYNGKSKFITYYSNVLHNKLREELEYLLTHKRKANMFPTSFEALLEDGFDLVNHQMEYVNTELMLDCLNLDKDELDFCKASLECSRVSNMATRDYLGWNDSKIRLVRKSLQSKLAFMLNF